LAHQMIRLAGLRPGRDVEIEFIGLRAGEKLHEDLFHPAEHLVPTGNSAIRLAAPRAADYAMLARSIDELEENARVRREQRVLQLLGRLVPEFHSNIAAGPGAAASGR
jgi:FlaA1/EpsC-like NDP-sugar epimerase